ncbi:MAG: SDR family NAD(P)-dependent oxidoreductase [Pseudomonadota bacterium]
MDVAGKTIVITGGASGIGRSLAIECARRGASMALADIDAEGAAAVIERVRDELGPNARCTAHPLDVSQLEDWRTFKDAALTEHGTIDGIINNAGITFTGTAQDTTYAQLEKVMSINFMGMVYGTQEFLPLLKARPEGFVANVSSLFGLVPMKQQSAYCASKFAIRAYTEVLAQEMKDSSVLVASVHPGHIGTNIIKNARAQGNVANTSLSEQEQELFAQAFKALGLAPGRAAEIILDGLKKKRSKIVVGKDAVRGDILSRLFPRPFINAINRAEV